MLELQQISFAYRRHTVLNDISLSVGAGEALGLLGHNGAGKTTLLSLISGLLPLQHGRMLLDGRPLHAGVRTFPSPLAIVPQDFAFYPMLSCRENLRFFGGVQGLHGARLRQRIDGCLAFAQLEAYAGKRAETLSGGLKRRLNLAIGLLTDPAILLLDEPTAGVDPHSRRALIQSILQLKQAGKTLIYTSHYLDEVEQLADRLVILDRGHVLLQGSWDTVRRQQAKQWELALERPLDEIELQALSAMARVEVQAAGRYRIETRGADDNQALWRWLADLNNPVRSLYTGEASLERLYLRLTQTGEQPR